MKIAISSTGNLPDSMVDVNFGRCAWFVIYDTDNRSVEYIPNPFRDQLENSGISAVHFLEQKGITKLVSGDFGIKVKPLIDSLRIQLIVIRDMKYNVNQIIELLNH